MKDTEGDGERALFTQMLMRTSVSLLRVVLRVDQSICRTDDAIHTPRLVQGSLTTHSATGQCVCVRARDRIREL